MTRKQRHLLTRIIVAAVLFLAGSLLHLPELAEMAVFLVCYVVVGWDIVWKAITNILHGQVFDENFLMTMLTGDADAVGKKVAGQLHLDQVYTELLPADKVDRVESLLKQKSEKGMLAFVGDGINDAPVLARADVGIAMGGLGSDAAIEAADVVLMTDEPSKIAAVMKIARKTIRIANQNIVFALGVKFLVLILGALGYANMWAAVFADVGVSIIAILNAIRAMRVKLPDMPAGSTNQG